MDMDLNIAALSKGERAMLSNILARGLASLTATTRTEGAVAAVETLQHVLRETPQLETYTHRVLLQLAFAARGRSLSGVSRQVLHRAAADGYVEKRGGSAWHITRKGWLRLWEDGSAAEILRDRYGLSRFALPAAAGAGS